MLDPKVHAMSAIPDCLLPEQVSTQWAVGWAAITTGHTAKCRQRQDWHHLLLIPTLYSQHWTVQCSPRWDFLASQLPTNIYLTLGPPLKLQLSHLDWPLPSESLFCYNLCSKPTARADLSKVQAFPWCSSGQNFPVAPHCSQDNLQPSQVRGKGSSCPTPPLPSVAVSFPITLLFLEISFLKLITAIVSMAIVNFYLCLEITLLPF